MSEWDPSSGSEPEPGQSVQGAVLERLLGKGGMGVAWLARREQRPVVLKLLDPNLARDPQLRQRFEREWEALRKVRGHPNVVEVLAVHGEAAAIELEFVAGQPLDALLRERGRIEPAQATRIALDVARGLSAIHGLGLIHRDLKPANIMLDAQGAAKLVDFGLAKDLFLSGLTQPGQLLGTAHYMAPEQWEDEGVDTHTDLFALGATLYHLITGQPPFPGQDMDEVADMACEGDYEPVGELVAGLPPGLQAIVGQLLEVDPAFRYGRAAALVADLEALLAGGVVSAPCVEHPSLPGGRRSLLGGEWFTIGSAAGVEVQLSEPGVEPKHAQIRREASGWVLRDFKSAGGTWVGEDRLGGAHALSDGERLRFGPSATLVFRNPRQRGERSYLRDVERREQLAPVVLALGQLADPRAALGLLEQLAEDPWEERALAHALTGLFGPALAQAVQARRAARAQQRPVWAAGQLAALAQRGASSVAEWLTWWHQARPLAPPQLVEPRPERGLFLQGQGPVPARFELSDLGLVHVGRDEKCQLRVDHPQAPRLLATLLRLNRRWVVIDGGSPAGTTLAGQRVQAAFFDPGQVLSLGPVQLRLEAGPLAPPGQVQGGLYAIDALAFDVLEEQGHPSVAAAAVGWLFAQAHQEWIEPTLAELYPEPAGREACAARLRALFAERAQRARALLPRLLGGDAGGDLAAWETLLAQRRPQLGHQVAPAGWSK
ncbi:MAG TPA: hypothetical protein DEA08_24285 [Planctomycetes bacterium]|nr:hypothetical protein [Planctomycetota bacterium]